LFNLDPEIFLNISNGDDSEENERLLWIKLVKMSDLEINQLGDILIKIDAFAEPIKELLFQTYTYNQSSKDLYYMEVTIKSYSNYVTEATSAFPSINVEAEGGKDFTISLKAFSLTRNVWIKDY